MEIKLVSGAPISADTGKAEWAALRAAEKAWLRAWVEGCGGESELAGLKARYDAAKAAYQDATAITPSSYGMSRRARRAMEKYGAVLYGFRNAVYSHSDYVHVKVPGFDGVLTLRGSDHNNFANSTKGKDDTLYFTGRGFDLALEKALARITGVAA